MACGSRPSDTACGHKTPARRRGETGLVRVRRGLRRFSACGPSLDGGPRAAAELGAGPRAVARRGRRRKMGLTGGARVSATQEGEARGWAGALNGPGGKKLGRGWAAGKKKGKGSC